MAGASVFRHFIKTKHIFLIKVFSVEYQNFFGAIDVF